MKIKEKNPKTKGNPLIIQEISVIGDLNLQKMSFKPELSFFPFFF